jgi:ribonuclease D
VPIFTGFICLASASTKGYNYVIDAIGTTRNSVVAKFGEVLTDTKILKVACGMDNDILRLQKDWSCFPTNVVDIQDMFLVWKQSNYEDCQRMSQQAIKFHFKEKGKSPSDEELTSYFSSLRNPGLDFLTFIFYGKSAKKDHAATFADWRKRPLHDQLFKYATFDSFYTRRLYFLLAAKVTSMRLWTARAPTVATVLILFVCRR